MNRKRGEQIGKCRNVWDSRRKCSGSSLISCSEEQGGWNAFREGFLSINVFGVVLAKLIKEDESAFRVDLVKNGLFITLSDAKLLPSSLEFIEI